MNKKRLWVRAAVALVCAVAVVYGIVTVGRMREQSEQIDKLENRIAEYQSSEQEQKTQNGTLQQSLEQAEEKIQKYEHYGYYQGNEDFSKIVRDNPIDLAYEQERRQLQESETSTTLAWGALEGKYLAKWQDKMNETLSDLEQSLNAADRASLAEAQHSWQSSIEADTNFANHAFIAKGVSESQGTVQAAETQVQKTRARTIELMEYAFMLNRDAVGF